MGAWVNGYTGVGVTVTVMDEGLDRMHIDLAANYVSKCT